MSSSFRNFLISFIIAAAIFGVIAFFAVGAVDKYILNPEKESGNASGEATATAAPETENHSSSPSIESGRTFSVLMIFNDYRPDIYKDYEVDKNVLDVSREKLAINYVYCLFSKEKGEAVFVPIENQTKVMIYGNEMSLEKAYNYADADYLRQKIASMIGMGIDYYIDFGVTSLIDIVDKIGGIKYQVPFDYEYENDAEHYSVRVGKGEKTLRGEEVMAFLRYNKYTLPTDKAKYATDLTMKALLQYTDSFLNKTKFDDMLAYIIANCDTDITLSAFQSRADLLFKLPSMKTSVINYPGKWKSGVFTPDVNAGSALFEQYR